jgi:hypothetical protein
MLKSSDNGRYQNYSGKRWSNISVEPLRATIENIDKIDDRFVVRYTQNIFANAFFASNTLNIRRLPPPPPPFTFINKLPEFQVFVRCLYDLFHNHIFFAFYQLPLAISEAEIHPLFSFQK